MQTPTRILLVEDDAADEELTVRALREQRLAGGLTVARDGEEAMRHLEAGPVPRVVFLDLKLPKLDGAAVLQRIRAAERTRHVPVVILTSSREEPDIERCYRLGANSYLVKPVDAEGFQRAVTEAGLYWMMRNHAPGSP
jgi:two-component system, response regulator